MRDFDADLSHDLGQRESFAQCTDVVIVVNVGKSRYFSIPAVIKHYYEKTKVQSRERRNKWLAVTVAESW